MGEDHAGIQRERERERERERSPISYPHGRLHYLRGGPENEERGRDRERTRERGGGGQRETQSQSPALIAACLYHYTL